MTPKELVDSLVREALLPAVSEVCTMTGKGYGECWGCPKTECARQLMPFADSVVDADTIAKAIQLLKSNRYFIGSVSGREVYERLLGGDFSEAKAARTLLAELIDCREDFITELAMDRVDLGLSTVDEAAKMAGHASKGDHPRNRGTFVARLAARAERREASLHIEEGKQRHTYGRPAQEWPS